MRRSIHWPTVALFALAGCGQDPPPPPRAPSQITVASGDAQLARAGVPLPEPIVFVVADRQGPMAGIQVAFSASDPRSHLSPSTAVSGPDGSVLVIWTPGGSLGTQSLTASTGSVSGAARATVAAGPPSLVSQATSPSQFTVAGRFVAEPPAVRVTDAFNNPIAGIAVSFADPTSRSTVVGANPTTSAAGTAGVTSWRISNQAGPFTLVATAGTDLTVNFVAFGIPAAVRGLVGDGQTANAGTLAPIDPAVVAVDDSGRGLPGVGVTYRVTQGGGRVVGTGTVTTGPDGIGAVAGWVLGPTPGPNELRADIPGTPGATFSAVGIAAAPAAAAAITATALAGRFGNFVTPTPAVRVTDAAGLPVAGTNVVFAVTSGGGALTYANRVSDFVGEARLGAWRLGGEPSQSLAATVSGLPPVVFTATADPVPASEFSIDVRFYGPAPTASQRETFDSAAARWSRSIRGDLADVPFDSGDPDNDLGFCGGQTLVETIDDVVIFATIEPFDGAGTVVGGALPCYLRDDNLLTAVGWMFFDVDDVANMEATGRFKDVVLHEMGHVLGVGSLWRLQNLIVGREGPAPFFAGAAAGAAFAAADPNLTFGGSVVPVENTGGPGTRDVHWRESVLRSELMTGFLSGTNPLSAVTVASLGDQGYLVDDASADPFTLESALRSLSGAPAFALTEAAWRTPVRTLDRRGQARRVFLPMMAPSRP